MLVINESQTTAKNVMAREEGTTTRKKEQFACQRKEEGIN
jgi:hypothetical protein